MWFTFTTQAGKCSLSSLHMQDSVVYLHYTGREVFSHYYTGRRESSLSLLHRLESVFFHHYTSRKVWSAFITQPGVFSVVIPHLHDISIHNILSSVCCISKVTIDIMNKSPENCPGIKTTRFEVKATQSCGYCFLCSKPLAEGREGSDVGRGPAPPKAREGPGATSLAEGREDSNAGQGPAPPEASKGPGATRKYRKVRKKTASKREYELCVENLRYTTEFFTKTWLLCLTVYVLSMYIYVKHYIP